MKCSACAFSDDNGGEKFICINTIPSEWAPHQSFYACPKCGTLQIDLVKYKKENPPTRRDYENRW